MDIPGYDAWKLATPPECDLTSEQERALEEERWEQEERLREAVADAMHNERGNLYLADIRKIVVEELNKLSKQPGEPEWQTRTPVPIPGLG
jgi:hypothetical protein